MEIDIEGKIRSRIEAILINDARNHAAIKMMASEEEPLENDPFAEERNLYQRIINNYRNAVSEVNTLLEENVGFLSGLSHIAETIKDKMDFQEICAQIIDCVLQDLGAEYCSLAFPSSDEPGDAPLYVEGVREQQKLIFTHEYATLLGSPEFAAAVAHMAGEGEEYFNIQDVYREPRFNNVDFPSVVRSLICVPITLQQKPLGLLILSHSMPRFFTRNHARALKILAATIAHLKLLTLRRNITIRADCSPTPPCVEAQNDGALSVILLNFEDGRVPGKLLTDQGIIRSICAALSGALGGKEYLLPYDRTSLLVIMPGMAEERLSERATGLREAFERWQASQESGSRGICLNLGYSSCESGEDLIRTLETATQMMHADQDESSVTSAAPEARRR